MLLSKPIITILQIVAAAAVILVTAAN